MLPGVRVMVFLHGTAIMHASAVGQPRAERVAQSRRRDAPVRDFAGYVPAEDAMAKVWAWQRRGADICYLSSHTDPADVALDGAVPEFGGLTHLPNDPRELAGSNLCPPGNG